MEEFKKLIFLVTFCNISSFLLLIMEFKSEIQ